MTIWERFKIFKRRSYPFQTFIFVLVSHSTVILALPFYLFSENIPLRSISEGPKTTSLLLLVIIAPIWETLVYQHVIFKLLQLWSVTKKKYLLYIIISSAVFGLAHNYSTRYVFSAFLSGLLYSFIYFFYHKNTSKAIGSTALIHSLRNLTAFLVRSYLI